MRLNSDEKYDKYQTGNETPYIVTPTILTLVITKGMTSTSTDLDNIFKIVISPERTNYTIAYKTAAFVSLNPFIYFSNYVKLLSTQTVDYNNCWACEIFYDYNINICFGLHGVSFKWREPSGSTKNICEFFRCRHILWDGHIGNYFVGYNFSLFRIFYGDK